MEKFYLDYLNNFLTVQAFADHYGVSVEFANKVIEEGKKQHTNKCKNCEFWVQRKYDAWSGYPKLKNDFGFCENYDDEYHQIEVEALDDSGLEVNEVTHKDWFCAGFKEK